MSQAQAQAMRLPSNTRGSFFDEVDPGQFKHTRKSYYPVSSNNFGMGKIRRFLEKKKEPTTKFCKFYS